MTPELDTLQRVVEFSGYRTAPARAQDHFSSRFEDQFPDPHNGGSGPASETLGYLSL